jgi:hypothetical protein
MLLRGANALAADALRVVATGLEATRLGVWFCIGWLDAGR